MVGAGGLSLGSRGGSWHRRSSVDAGDVSGLARSQSPPACRCRPQARRPPHRPVVALEAGAQPAAVGARSGQPGARGALVLATIAGMDRSSRPRWAPGRGLRSRRHARHQPDLWRPAQVRRAW
jgi:hypothetical protein